MGNKSRDNRYKSNKNKKIKLPKIPKNIYYMIENIDKIDNGYLLLYKCAGFDEYNKNKVNDTKNNKEIVNLIDYLEKASEEKKVQIKTLNERIRSLWEPIKIYDKPFNVKQNSQSRWAIGIGGTSPYGNLLIPTIHPLYGVPYIPASTLKGLMRRTWIDKICKGDENAEQVIRLFGSGAEEQTDENNENCKAGQLIFFDSFPTVNCGGKIVKDVFTQHYREYYQKFGEKPPTDDLEPLPIEFFCLEGFEFEIYIGSRKKMNDKGSLAETLEYVFSDLGIGAKTSLGYGRGEINKIDGEKNKLKSGTE